MPRTKNEIALDLLAELHIEGLLPYRAVVADAGYGISVDFRRGLDERGVLCVVGIAGNDDLPTPFTSEEIRGGCPPGRTLRYRHERVGEPAIVRISRYASGDLESCLQESWQSR